MCDATCCDRIRPTGDVDYSKRVSSSFIWEGRNGRTKLTWRNRLWRLWYACLTYKSLIIGGMIGGIINIMIIWLIRMLTIFPYKLADRAISLFPIIGPILSSILSSHAFSNFMMIVSPWIGIVYLARLYSRSRLSPTPVPLGRACPRHADLQSLPDISTDPFQADDYFRYAGNWDREAKGTEVMSPTLSPQPMHRTFPRPFPQPSQPSQSRSLEGREGLINRRTDTAAAMIEKVTPTDEKATATPNATGIGIQKVNEPVLVVMPVTSVPSVPSVPPVPSMTMTPTTPTTTTTTIITTTTTAPPASTATTATAVLPPNPSSPTRSCDIAKDRQSLPQSG
jgi:hypothetical protein